MSASLTTGNKTRTLNQPYERAFALYSCPPLVGLAFPELRALGSFWTIDDAEAAIGAYVRNCSDPALAKALTHGRVYETALDEREIAKMGIRVPDYVYQMREDDNAYIRANPKALSEAFPYLDDSDDDNDDGNESVKDKETQDDIVNLEFADCITPHVFVGGIEALTAFYQKPIEERENWRVISVVTYLDINGTAIPHGLSAHVMVQAEDSPDTDLSPHFRPSHDFIQRAIDDGKHVLIHCMSGYSRSVTIAAAHLILARKVSAKTALETIARQRENADPNPGFRAQLKTLAAAVLEK